MVEKKTTYYNYISNNKLKFFRCKVTPFSHLQSRLVSKKMKYSISKIEFFITQEIPKIN